MLRETVRRFRANLRPYDTLGRYAGAEFLIMVPGCDAQQAAAKAERLRTALESKPLEIAEWGKFADGTGGGLRLTLSFGVVAADKLREPEPLLRAVSAAMVRARKAGQNRVEVALAEDGA